MELTLIGIAVFLSTMSGGILALRRGDASHLIVGFSAGAVVGVAFFDLMPEALELSMPVYTISTTVSCIAVGFLSYLLLDRILLLHSHAHDEPGSEHHEYALGHVRAGSLSAHSFLDGLGIGLGFQVSTSVGLIIAAAVLAHDFSDGINTVNVLMRHGGTRKSALRWLMVDAVAPLLGIVAATFITVSNHTLGLLLALFAGFFLYIGASDLIPESHHTHPKFMTTAMTLLGAGTLFLVVRLAAL